MSDYAAAGRTHLPWHLLPFSLLFFSGQSVAQGAVAEEENRYAIEEVIVTARKREERLIDTPVAAAVLTAEELDRYRTRDLAEITQRIPGVQITHAGGGGAGGNMIIRGVGNLAGDYGADQPVSLVIDGMSFSRGHVLDTGFFDVQAVEVLRGPQALYFGKNSPAGVISVTSMTPRVGDDWDGFLRASYEFETEDPVFEGAVSIPLGDRFATRLAIRYQDMQGGWLDNSAALIDNTISAIGPMYPSDLTLQPRGPASGDFPEQEQTVVRWTTVFQPNDSFDATLKIFYSESEQNDIAPNVLYRCADGVGGHPWYFGGGWEDTTQTCTKNPRWAKNAALPPAEVANAHPFIDENDRFFNYYENDIYTLNMNWDITPNLTLTSVTGYWDYFHREYTNYDWTSFAVIVSEQGESGDSWTQEIRLQSNFDDGFNFMVGGFYENMDRDLDAPVQIVPEIFTGGATPNTDPNSFYFGSYINYHQHWDNKIESYSLFASFDWELSEKWAVSGGLRYTEEDRSSFGGNLYEAGFGFSPGGAFYDPARKDDNVSPELTVSFHPTEDVLLYAAYKTGFQSFGISNPGTVDDRTNLPPDVANEQLIFDDMTVDGFEIGMKGYFFDGRFSADLIGFWYEYTDLQVGIFNADTTTFTLQNAGESRARGFELQGVFQATENLQLRTSLSYSDLEFLEYEDAGCNTPDNDARTLGLPQTIAPECVIGPDGEFTQDMSGEKYGGPPFQANIGATWEVPIGNWAMQMTGDLIYHEKGRETLRQPDTELPSRTVVHLSAVLFQQDGPWEAAVICSNCFNEKYILSTTNKPLGKTNPGVDGDLVAQIAPPRLVTAQVTYRLGRR